MNKTPVSPDWGDGEEADHIDWFGKYMGLIMIADCLIPGYSVDRLYKLTRIDRWFLHKMKRIVDMQTALEKLQGETVDREMLLQLKQCGFSDRQIAAGVRSTERAIRHLRRDRG